MATGLSPRDGPCDQLDLKADVTGLRGDFLKETKMINERTLGKGFSGQVILASYQDKPEEKRAVKISSKADHMNEGMFWMEVAILQKIAKIKHPHILNSIEGFVSRDSFIITMPYYPNGSLKHNLTGMTSDRTIKYFLQLTCAIRFLHANQIVHRDIKPDNVLVDNDDNVVLIDFGFACPWIPGQNNPKKVGTKGYLPPEVYTQKTYDLYKGDLYALGVVLFNLVFQTPAAGSTDFFLYHVHKTKELPAVLRTFIQNLLCPDPKLRWDDKALVEAVLKWPEMSNMLKRLSICRA